MELVEGAASTNLADEPLVPGQPRRLENGARLQLGELAFTFYTCEGIIPRVRDALDEIERRSVSAYDASPSR